VQCRRWCRILPRMLRIVVSLRDTRRKGNSLVPSVRYACPFRDHQHKPRVSEDVVFGANIWWAVPRNHVCGLPGRGDLCAVSVAQEGASLSRVGKVKRLWEGGDEVVELGLCACAFTNIVSKQTIHLNVARPGRPQYKKILEGSAGPF
jgi:hypothetical protein